MNFFFQRIHFFFFFFFCVCVWGGGVFFYKLTRNPNLTIFVCVWGGAGEGGGGKCMCMNKCFKWQFYSSRRTPVQNHFEIHAFCRSYGPEKLIYVTFKCDLGLQPT